MESPTISNYSAPTVPTGIRFRAALPSPRPPPRCVLIFTEVVVGLSYTLNHYPVLNVKSVIFDAVPFELLDDLGGAPGNPRVVLPAKYAGEPKPKLPTSDPLIVHDPVDEQTPHERYEDPHTSNTAME